MWRAFAKATPIHELRVWTLSNFLSVLRILLLPFIYRLLKAGGRANDSAAIALMGVAVASDILDGLIARRTGGESNLGKILDPVADKICIGTMAVILVALRDFPVWLVAAILGRDALIVICSTVLIGRKRIVLSSNWLGKATTLFMAFLILAYTLEWPEAARYIMIGVLLFLVASTASYGITMVHHIRSRQLEDTRERDP
ncbi:MAG: hypothetical protein A2Z06_02125 [Candidatus Glassbacteria bacterium RBG_16_58_8]|uniref:CDP-diacylglycerol--glycerol-3-phosphate 3-phosphatidyltransferase n=1 Tax=Candidatus Glassbacteria bacterium RBG_16_58_8 TaxID=1817866 RepID=A0A1F5YC04_9BACT|nr:MAG: hypothetical protein A2Z06_02125 [Candidatus Glassbacteria bacterium RBG_16_58_8]